MALNLVHTYPSSTTGSHQLTSHNRSVFSCLNTLSAFTSHIEAETIVPIIFCPLERYELHNVESILVTKYCSRIPSIITCFMHLIIPRGQTEFYMGVLNCVLKLKSLIWPETLFEVLGQLYILIFCFKSKVIALVSSFNSIMTSPSLL